MPEYEVTLIYRLEYVGSVTVRAKDEETATDRVQSSVEKIEGMNVDKFIQFCDSDIDCQEDNVEIDDVTEV